MVCHENSCLSGFTYQKESRLCKPNKIPDNCNKIITTKFNDLVAKRVDLRYSCEKCTIKFTLNLTRDKCEPCPKNCNYCSVISTKNGLNLTARIDSSFVHNMLSTLKSSETNIVCNCKANELYNHVSKECKNCDSICETCRYREGLILIDCVTCSIGYGFNLGFSACKNCTSNCEKMSSRMFKMFN